MCDQEVYLGLGGNIGDSAKIIQQVSKKIESTKGVYDFELSRLYQTAPVSDIPQADYVNAVCRFKTNLTVEKLWKTLQTFEKELGKLDKPKNAPRVIDIDILFFGCDYYHQEGLQIPHPRWKERLFVLIPLLDLISTLKVPVEAENDRLEILELDLKLLIEQFTSSEMEKQCVKYL